ncbi:MAG: hypothetical protein QHH13_09550 [Melioribacter sp.]|uniref:hypothetical protein n=1 Tax=Rosettibacter primus TaxID=3111523 RepID=UPI00247B699B|nr:hypothetical protein [Melioribacter sp.]
MCSIKNNIKINFISFVFTFIVFGCESSNEPFDFANEYMSLNIGDIRQYCMPYSNNPEIHTVWKIVGKTYRSDGQEVFLTEWYYYSYDPNNKYVSYYFIRDGFLYFTELEKSSNYPENPYSEQRLAKILPEDGDIWMQTVGYLNPDSSKDYLTAKHLNEFNTPASKFKDVFAIISSKGTSDTEISEIYYAKYFGHIGYSVIGDSSSFLLVNYMSIKGREVGNYVEMENSKSIYKKDNFKIPNPFIAF